MGDLKFKKIYNAISMQYSCPLLTPSSCPQCPFEESVEVTQTVRKVNIVLLKRIPKIIPPKID